VAEGGIRGHLVVGLTVELSSVLGVPHPVVHVDVRQAVEQQLHLLEVKHCQQRLWHYVVKTLFRCDGNEDIVNDHCWRKIQGWKIDAAVPRFVPSRTPGVAP
jgi:hypothetical protein